MGRAGFVNVIHENIVNVIHENIVKSVFALYLVCPCKISALARATMEAAAGARAAALGVGADAWHSAPNLEARGGETKKPFFGLKFQTGLRRRGGIGARPRDQELTKCCMAAL